MNTEARGPHAQLLHRLVLGGCLCAFVAGGAYVAFRPAPKPTLLPATALQLQGYRLVSTRTLAPPANHRNLATSEVVELTFHSDAAGPSLQLRSAAVRTPGHDQLNLKTMRDRVPSMALKNITAAKPGAPPASNAQVAVDLGWLDGQAAAQACITASGHASAVADTLSKAVSAPAPAGWQARLQALAGVAKVTEWQCVFVTIVLPAQGAVAGHTVATTIEPQMLEALHAAWAKLLSAWPAQGQPPR